MRIYAKGALQSQTYLEKCYDSFLRSANRGKLTLLNEQYFDFGVQAMKKVDLNMTEHAKKEIMGDQELLDLFLDCSKSNDYLEEDREKQKIFKELLDQVVNARFSEE
eukprot:jgi/Psemu1/60050/gm1.60050_g